MHANQSPGGLDDGKLFRVADALGVPDFQSYAPIFSIFFAPALSAQS